MRQSYAPSTNQHARSGFTLIELLVVISIIAILMTLSAAAILRVMGTWSISSTKTAIQRLDSSLSQQTAFAADKIRQEVPSAYATTLANNDSTRAKVIHMKLRWRGWFPQTFYEALTSVAGGYQARPGYVAYLAQYNITPSTVNPSPQPYESAACLYMILQHGPERASDSDVATSANTQIINGIPCLVDSWRQPLVFCRWPTGDLQPGGAGGTGISPVNPSGAQAGFNDPQDPQGTLTNPTWWSSQNRSTFESLCHPLPNPAGGPLSLNLAPVIVSTGADKQLGLSLSSLQILAPSPSPADDNLYNR